MNWHTLGTAHPRTDLWERRRRLGLSQAALAERLGVRVETISRWESGHKQAPDWLPLAIAGLEAEQRVDDVFRRLEALVNRAAGPVAAREA